MTLLEEAEERKEINKRQNREFIDMYVEWIKKHLTTNGVINKKSY